MNKEIKEKVLREVLINEDKETWKHHSRFDVNSLIEKAISRTIELMEEKGHSHIKPNCKLCFSMWKNGFSDGEEDRDTELKKEIVKLKEKLRLAIIGIPPELDKEKTLSQVDFIMWGQIDDLLKKMEAKG